MTGGSCSSGGSTSITSGGSAGRTGVLDHLVENLEVFLEVCLSFFLRHRQSSGNIETLKKR